MSSVGTINEFNVKLGSWTSYVDRLEIYFDINNIEEKMKIKTLISFMGTEAYELLENLASPNKPSDLTFAEARELMRCHLEPPSLVLAERYRFRNRKQGKDESIPDFVVELKKLSRNCEYGDSLSENLRDQFVCGIFSNVIRKRLFAEGVELEFNEAVTIANLLEASEVTAVVRKTEGCRRGRDGRQDSSRRKTCNKGSGNSKCPMPWGVPNWSWSAVMPRCHPIPDGVYPGRMFRVQGTTPTGAQRFSVNLQCGPGIYMEDDIAFHLDFRFAYGDNRNVVVRNNQINGQWMTEERYGAMPLTIGQPFETLIVCKEENYKVYVNGKFFTTFKHRIPYQRVSHLTVTFDAMVFFVGFEESKDCLSEDSEPESEADYYGTFEDD